MNYTCPICGYDKLELPPLDFSICPSCGTEFGNDDFEFSHEELRQQWINNGMHWWSVSDPVPQNWNPLVQIQHVMPNKISTETTNSKRLVTDRPIFWDMPRRNYNALIPVQLTVTAQVTYSYATLQG